MTEDQLISKSFLDKSVLRISYISNHSAFKKHPILTMFRIFLWGIFKAFKYKPSVKIHDSSIISLDPVPKRGIHGFLYIFRNDYEPQVKYAINNYVKHGDICYDIGANIGFWTLKIAELVGSSGKVHAFEPMSENLVLLKSNIKASNLESIIEISPFALGETTGTATIYIPLDPGSTSMAPESSEDKSEEVILKKLDDVWRSQGSPAVKFIKMDVEGSEPFVLAGGSEFFKTVRPVIICEINSRKLAALHKNPQDIFDVFYAWNYESFIFDIFSQRLIKSNYIKDEDFIFVPL